ncbi:MAG: leucine-rich repeat domain-containing protein [Clostridia bacterium]|nr:leucine-rich repeat domain-containing protein [Clostridia bacterium]
MKTGKKIAVSLLGIICTASLAGGISACKAKKSPVGMPEHLTTVRMALPNDGSLPTAHTGIENIGYMATVLDNQPYYHAYARNSAKVMGYEQITQTWKDYKGKELSGYDSGVMICSDLSYSTFVKSGTQTCFVNDKAYMRSSSKPGKNTVPTTANWNGGTPEYFDKETYLTRYGEYSTELSVYVINADTVSSWSDITTEENGTYSQTFYLKNEAACYYQYKLKTNGNLKGYPDFDYINITFNFDKDWNVLSSYCEEKAQVAPKALGGAANKGTFKTNTTFYYGEGDFDNAHYAYFDDFFKEYVGKNITPGGSQASAEKPELLDVLAGGFGKVIGDGQQFSAKLKIGDTDYDGKIYARLADMSDIMNSLDVRLALEKAGSGKQDLYLEFNKGAVNVYYSNNFAMTANLDAVKTVIGQFSEWVKQFANGADASAASYAVAEDEEGGLDLGALLASLKLEYTDNTASISLDTDNLLGTGIGAKVSLNFDRKIEEDGSNSYSFKNASLGSITYDSNSIALSLGLSTDSSAIISHDAVSTAANLADYASGVYSMLGSDTLKVNIGLDGTDNKVLSYLDGVKLSAEAYVALGSEIATKADIFAEYAGLSVKLSAYYDINIHGGNYGKVYLNLTEFNGTKLDAKVYSNLSDTVTAVKELISAVNGATPATLSEAGTDAQVNKLAGIVNGVLKLDFGKVIGKDLYASNSEIRVNADVDAIVGALGLDLNGMQFGTAALKLNLNDKKNASLSLGLSGLGLTVNVAGSSQEITEPNMEEYLDATALVNLVNKAADAAKEIIEAQDIVFDIDATAVIDDIPLAIEGNGEVVWKNGKMRVAIDANLSVANGTSSDAKDSVALKVVYDESVTEDNEPFVKFSVGSVAMHICKKDIAEVKDGINLIKKNIDLLLNGEKTGNATPAQAVATYGAAAQSANVADDIKSILASENVQKVLSAVLGFAGDLNVNLSGKDLNTLVITHLTNGSLTLGTDNNLSLILTTNNNDGTPVLDLSASVEKGTGSKLSAVSSEIDKLEVYSTANAGEAFATVVYNYMFAAFDSLSVKNVLGSDTFAVNVILDGKNSAIPQLSGVYVDANLYYTEALEGTTIAENRLVEADINLDINGTKVKANARYNAQNLYISLDEMNGTVINGVKFTASRYDIYTAAEQLINIITDENAMKSLSKLFNPASAATPATYAAVLADEGEKTALTSVVEKLLSFDFTQAFSFGKVDGVNIATVEVDYILGALGVNAPQIGTATVGVNPTTHKIDANLTLNGNAWATLTAEATGEHTYADNWKDGYIDISFINTLLDDIVKTAVKDNEFQTLYTMTGNLTVNVPVAGNVNINDAKLSVGISGEGKFYFTLAGNLEENKILGGIYVAHAMPISVTYSDGYLTMGRVDDNGNPIYKVMTLEYLTTYLLNKNNSPIRWLLNTNPTAWGMICDNVKVNIDNGLTTPQSYYLYKQNEVVKPGDTSVQKTFNLSDLLVGLTVKLAGENANAVYGDAGTAITKLGLADNYYALDANLESLLGTTFKHLYLGILRGENGLTGLKAYTEIAGALKITVNLDNLTTAKEAAAPDYLAEVLKDHAIDFHKYDNSVMDEQHKKPTFGCYNTESAINSSVVDYETLDMLGDVNLKVVGGGIADSHDVMLRSTSTVYLRDSASPVWADDAHTRVVIYTDANGNDLGKEIQITADTVIYASSTEAYEVSFNLGAYGDSYSLVLAPEDKFTHATVESETHIFAGWYADSALTNPATCANDLTAAGGIRTAYAKFIEKDYTAKNGVKYSAYIDEKGNTCFAVSGFDATAVTDGVNYTQSGTTLVIADNIGGFTVNKINADAFMGKSLKNVIVPETVTWVGAQAFKDNYAIESVAFLADKVYLEGTGKSAVFYGCSLTDGGTSTNIIIYYNVIEAEAGNDWTYFRDKNNGHYIGRSSGGTLNGGGNWSYTVFKLKSGEGVDLTDSNFGFNVDGIKISAMSADLMISSVYAKLNAKSAASGVINEYVVTVNKGYENNGKLNEIVISVEVNDKPYYLVTVDVAGAIIQGTTETFNGSVYAKAETEVTLLPPEGKIFTEISASGLTVTDGKFTMPYESVSINVTCDVAPISKVTINSAVAYTYAGTGYAANEQAVIDDVEQNVTLLGTIEATGYLFLGWAYNNGTSLEFTDNVVRYGNYYAIWAEAREGITSVSPLTEGTNPNAATVTVDTTKANSFYKWYTDSTFTTEVNTVTLANTVLYGRLYYTLTVNGQVSGVSGFGTSKEITINNTVRDSYTTKMLEKDEVYLKDKQDDGKVYFVLTKETNNTVENPLVNEIRIKTKESVTGGNNTRVLSVSCDNANWTQVADHVEVTGNITFTFSYTK